MSIFCSACKSVISEGDEIAHGPDGDIHYRCFKRGTAQGREVNLMTLSDDLGKLTKRVQDLERIVAEQRGDGPLRVGPPR